MESSSNDSFAWTEASNCSSASSESTKNDKPRSQSDNESEYGKSYKKKLQRDLFEGDKEKSEKKSKKRKATNEESECETIKSPKKKKIKLEPESDIDTSIKKNKSISKDIQIESNDESYLNMRVKEEVTTVAPASSIQSKNKKKTDKLSDSQESVPYNNDISEIINTEDHLTKTKKKKKKKKESSEAEYETDYKNIEDMFSVEETEFYATHKCINSNCENSTKQHLKDRHSEKHKSNSGPSDFDFNRIENNNEAGILENNESEESQSQLQIGPHQKPMKHDYKGLPEKNNKRLSRISDRIRFEDEDNINYDKNMNLKDDDLKRTKLKKFLRVNDNLKSIHKNLESNSILSEDDEIWHIRCPHYINIDAFQNITITLDKKFKIKVDGSTYEGSLENDLNPITVLSQHHNKFVLRNLQSNGLINFRKRVPKVHIQYDDIMLNNNIDFIPLPETKLRHPLFGNDYKKAIKLSASVKQKLIPNYNNLGYSTNKIIKTRKNKNIVKDNDSELFVEEKQENKETFKKKKVKKHKHNNDHDQIKETKRNKYNPYSVEAWDSEKAIEENLFNF